MNNARNIVLISAIILSFINIYSAKSKESELSHNYTLYNENPCNYLTNAPLVDLRTYLLNDSSRKNGKLLFYGWLSYNNDQLDNIIQQIYADLENAGNYILNNYFIYGKPTKQLAGADHDRSPPNFAIVFAQEKMIQDIEKDGHNATEERTCKNLFEMDWVDGNIRSPMYFFCKDGDRYPLISAYALTSGARDGSCVWTKLPLSER